MIEADKRKAIYLLHKEGMGVREISRNMNISTNTVTTIIGQAGELPQTTRSDKMDIIKFYSLADIDLTRCIFMLIFFPFNHDLF